MEERYWKLFDEALDAIFVVDAETGILVDCNRAATKLVGRKKSEIIGRHQRTLHPQKGTKDGFTRGFKKLRDEDPSQVLEAQVITKNGEIREVAIKASVFELEGKRFLQGTFRDITERKKAEEKLRESEEKYSNLVENSQDSIAIVDFMGNGLFANETTERLTGYTPAEGKGMNIRALIPKKLWPKTAALLLKARSGKPIPFFEYELKRKDGTVVPVETGGQAIFKDGKPVAVQIITRDITEHKKAEESIRISEEKFRKIFENASDCIVYLDKSGRILDANRKALQVFGGSREEALGKHFTKLAIISLEEVPTLLRNFENILSGKKVTLDVTIKNKKGQKIPLECSASVTKMGNTSTITVIARDVTERKRAEKALAESELQYRSLVENVGAGVAITDLEGRFVFVNRALCKMIGYSKEEMVGKPFADFLHPEDRKWIQQIFLESWKNPGRTLAIEFRVIHKRDHVIHMYSCPTATIDNNKIVGFNAIISDITERKNAEEALRKRESDLRRAQQIARFGSWVFDLKTDRVEFSDEIFNILGITKEQFNGTLECAINLVKPEDRTRVQKCYEDLVIRHKPVSMEYSIIRPDGSVRHLWGNGEVEFDKKGDLRYIIGTVRDITERKKAEEAAEKERQELDRIIDSSPIIIFYKDNEGKFLRVNQAFAEALDLSKEEFLGKTVFDFYSPKIAQSMTKDDTEVFESGRPKLGIIEQYESARGIRWVQTDKIPIVKENGSVIGLVGFAQDITERKKIENRLRISEFKFRTVADFTYDWEYWLAPDGTFVYMSPSCERITGYKPKKFIKNPRLLQQIANPEDAAAVDAHFDLFNSEEVNELEFRIKHRNGETRWVHHLCQPVFNHEGKFLGRRASNRDITEQKKAEKEKTNLLHELGDYVNKLGCLYEISKLAEDPNISLTKFLTQTANLLPLAWQWPAITRARIVWKKDEYKSRDFNESKWKLESKIKIQGKNVGSVQIYYLEEKPMSDEGPFRMEERELMDVVAERLGKTIERHELNETIRKYSEHLEELVRARTKKLVKTQKQLFRSEKLAAMGELSAMVGHDLRTPMQSIMVTSSYLNEIIPQLSDSKLNREKAIEVLKHLNDSVQYADQIIMDMQEFSPRRKPKIHKISLNTTIKKVIAQTKVPKKTLIITELARLPRVETDKEMIQRVFTNLITNAIQAMDEKGTLTISTKKTDKSVEISFKDTGSGIPKEHLKKIFSAPFTTKTKGMGFGLLICKNFVKILGGNIIVKSKKGKGSTFKVKLPIRQKEKR